MLKQPPDAVVNGASLQGVSVWVVHPSPAARFQLVLWLREAGAVCAFGPDMDAIERPANFIAPGDTADLLIAAWSDQGVCDSSTFEQLRQLARQVVWLPTAEAEGPAPVDADVLPLPLRRETALPWLARHVQVRRQTSAEISRQTGQASIASSLPWCATTAHVLDRFVNTLPQRLEQIQAALRETDMQRLEQAVRRLHGAANAHGYPTLSHAAQHVVARLKHDADDVESTKCSTGCDTLAEVQALAEAVDELNDLCERVTPFPPDVDDSRPLPPGA